MGWRTEEISNLDDPAYIAILGCLVDQPKPLSSRDLYDMKPIYDIMEMDGLKRRLHRLFTMGFLDSPDEPFSRGKRYRLTQKGSDHWLKYAPPGSSPAKPLDISGLQEKFHAPTGQESGAIHTPAAPQPAAARAFTPGAVTIAAPIVGGNILFAVLRGRHDDGSLDLIDFQIEAGSRQHELLIELCKGAGKQFLVLEDDS